MTRTYGWWSILAMAAVTVWALAASPAGADLVQWTGGGDNTSFNDPLNWSTEAVPGTADIAAFETMGATTVVFGSSVANQQLWVSEGSVTLDLEGNTYTLSPSDDALSVSIGQGVSEMTPTLKLVSDVLTAEGCGLGLLTGSTGRLIVEGSETQWVNTDQLLVGMLGTGFIELWAGASMDSYSRVVLGDEKSGADLSKGEVILGGYEGQTTTWDIGDDSVYDSVVVIGDSGTGSVNVNSYSTVTVKEHQIDGQGNRSSSWVFIGSQAGSTGTLSVAGTEAVFHLEHAPMIVGEFGHGLIYVNQGGLLQLSQGELWIATGAGSIGEVEVKDAGSRLVNVTDYPSIIGAAGDGLLRIGEHGDVVMPNLIIGQQDGATGNLHMFLWATLSCGAVTFADEPGSYGRAYIDQEAVWTIHGRAEIGRNGVGEIAAEAGAHVVQTLDETFAMVLGVEADGAGSIYIEDADTLLQLAGELVIGQVGSGSMTVAWGAGAVVKQCHLATLAGSTGELILSGEGAVFQTLGGGLLVGREGSGTAVVELEAQLLAGEGLTIAEQPGAVGAVTVESTGRLECGGLTLGRWGASETAPRAAGFLGLRGDGSVVESSRQAVIGHSGYGEVVISDRGTLWTAKGESATGTSGVIGAGVTGEGLVAVHNGTWQQDGALVVGWSGRGTLNIEEFGLVESESGLVGRSDGSTGTVDLSGTNATWNVLGSLSLGGTLTEEGGAGELNLNHEDSFVRVGYGPDSHELVIWPGGQLRLNGGRVVVGGDAFLGPRTLWINGGTVTLRGGTIEAEQVNVDGTLRGSGNVQAGATVVGSGGVLSPGTGLGTIEFGGNLTLAGNAEFEIEGTELGQYDLVRSTGEGVRWVAFGGTLTLHFNGTFANHTVLSLFHFGDFAGNFETIAWDGLAAGQGVEFDPTSGSIIIVSTVPLEFSGHLDYDWVYPNTDVTTQGRHLCLLTVTFTSETEPGEGYNVYFEDDGPGDNFVLGDVIDHRPDEPTMDMVIVGGRRDVATPSAPGSPYTVRVTLEGQQSGRMAAIEFPLELRLLGDIVADGIVNASDKLEMNKKLNGLENLPGVELRNLDLSGDGALVNAEDKLAINQILNGLVVP